jgi:hypothetical protein
LYVGPTPKLDLCVADGTRGTIAMDFPEAIIYNIFHK